MVMGLTHWDGYTIFSVISGVLLVVMALVPGEKAGTRVGLFLGGIAMAAYGVYVANQATGTYYFSVYVFLIPIVAVVYFLKNLGGSSTRARTPGRTISNPSLGSTGATQPVRPAHQVTQPRPPVRAPSPPPRPAAPRTDQNPTPPTSQTTPGPSRPDESSGKIVIGLDDLGSEEP
jgi:hypothetical protein